MDENQSLITIDKIPSLVYIIRGQQVMLDSDLAELYGYDVKRLNEQVTRNIERFPNDFMFELEKDEWDNLKSQIATSSWGGKRKMPRVFTEQGVYMLTTVLKKELAVKQSITIMRAFKAMRHYVQENKQFVTKKEMYALKEHVDEQLSNMKYNIDVLAENFITEKDLKEFIIFKGQKFEADVAYMEIYSLATENILVVDDYVNIKTLQLLSNKQKDVNVTIFTRNRCHAQQKLTSSVVNDFNEEYPILRLKPNNEWHDRCVFIDYGTENEQLYLCGSSSKDAGAKICSIIKYERPALYHPIMDQMLEQEDLVL